MSSARSGGALAGGTNGCSVVVPFARAAFASAATSPPVAVAFVVAFVVVVAKASLIVEFAGGGTTPPRNRSADARRGPGDVPGFVASSLRRFVMFDGSSVMRARVRACVRVCVRARGMPTSTCPYPMSISMKGWKTTWAMLS